LSKVTAILLAAGRSQRMGRNKLLLDWNGRPLVRGIAETLIQAELDVLVVLGHEAAEVQAALIGLPLKFDHNESFADGIGSSISAGAAAASPVADAFLIVLGDMPNLSHDLLHALLSRANRDRIVVPRHGVREGNPVCFGAEFRFELEALTGDRGARSIIEAHRSQVVSLDWKVETAFADLDRPEDLT
jgi:molybdenum cofactor cytidylyltransferase